MDRPQALSSGLRQGSLHSLNPVIGPLNDPTEHEARRVATSVVAQLPQLPPGAAVVVPTSHRPKYPKNTLGLSEEGPRPVSLGNHSALTGFAARLRHEKIHGGRPLTPMLRVPLERAFASDFTAVKIHENVSASQLARDINSEAFTLGDDVFFRHGALRMHTSDGLNLLAHELVHVLQARHSQGTTLRRSPSSRRLNSRSSQLKIGDIITGEEFRTLAENQQNLDPKLIAMRVSADSDAHLIIPRVALRDESQLTFADESHGVFYLKNTPTGRHWRSKLAEAAEKQCITAPNKMIARIDFSDDPLIVDRQTTMAGRGNPEANTLPITRIPPIPGKELAIESVPAQPRNRPRRIRNWDKWGVEKVRGNADKLAGAAGLGTLVLFAGGAFGTIAGLHLGAGAAASSRAAGLASKLFPGGTIAARLTEAAVVGGGAGAAEEAVRQGGMEAISGGSPASIAKATATGAGFGGVIGAGLAVAGLGFLELTLPLQQRALRRAIENIGRRGGTGLGGMAGKCHECARKLLELNPGSKLIYVPGGRTGHVAVQRTDGVVLDPTLRDNLQSMGAKVSDIQIGKSEFSRQEWDVLVERFPTTAEEVIGVHVDPFAE